MAIAIAPSSSIHSLSLPANPNTLDVAPSSDQFITTTLADSAHAFLKSDPSLHDAALVLAKRYLDPLASSVSETQNLRLQSARRKRKRGDDDGLNYENVLRLREVYLQGLSLEQIWEQSRRVIDAACQEVEGNLDHLKLKTSRGDANSSPRVEQHRYGKMMHFEDGHSLSGSESDDEKLNSDNAISLRLGETSHAREEGHVTDAETFSDGIDSDKGMENDESAENVEEDEDGEELRNVEVTGASKFIEDKHGLDDSFFSIDDFNKHTEFLEQQDIAGDPNDGATSDEEVDWEIDPMSQSFSIISGTSKTSRQEIKSQGSEENHGPAFGDADLNAPWSGSENDAEEERDIPMDDITKNNANELYYADFFAPPATARSKKKRPLAKTQPSQEETKSQASSPRPSSPTKEDLQRTTSVVHRDIFSDESLSDAGSNPDLFASSDSESESDTTGPPKPKKAHLSSHERRQLSLADQIRHLEAAAVQKRAWTLAGEARAADRPLNSLLEENLASERVGKSLPVVTPEVSSSLEELVKARILARQFDEVPRRRPGAEDDALAAASARRGLAAGMDLEAAELERRKEGGKGLAEVYEEEYRRRNEEGYQSVADKKLSELHRDIEGLWKNVGAELDALSNWHYTPKPPGVEIRVVDDKPRVLMEEARPAGVGGVGLGGGGSGGVLGEGEGGLAPQEVFKVGATTAEQGKKGSQDQEEGVVTTSGGGVVGIAELTRKEKLRRRRRENERAKKRKVNAKIAGGGRGREKEKIVGARGGKRKEQQEERNKLLGELQRADVKVIGKGGELADVKGVRARVGNGRGRVSGGKLKL
ncbi:U3 snoRNP protein [Thelotrema lepadinum]|nr:U3 snoRNP protein [Thelotrema lepadinum]